MVGTDAFDDIKASWWNARIGRETLDGCCLRLCRSAYIGGERYQAGRQVILEACVSLTYLVGGQQQIECV